MAKTTDQLPERQLALTSWAISNPAATYLLAFSITLFGILGYVRLPKEQFPEVVIPTVLVTTIYPGTSPADIENLVTRPIEKEIKSIKGVRRVQSNSVQGYSLVQVEFGTNEDIARAKIDVKDAVDRAKSELPKDLKDDPSIREVDISEMPVLYINLSGDFEPARLKVFADLIQDRVEQLREVTRVDIVGALDREILVYVDMFKMQAAGLSFGDIESAIGRENVTVSAGEMRVGDMQRAIQVSGEFRDVSEIRQLVIRNNRGAPIYLGDIADVIDGFHDRESYARLNGQPSITLNLVKRSGENLINTIDQTKAILAELQATQLPPQLNITLTGDQSRNTRDQLNSLMNSIIIGFGLVALVMMFFMGINNALFVASSIPLASFLTFLAIDWLGYTLNTVVLFSLLLALGIIVDNAVVVVENIYRIFENGKRDIKYAARYGSAEVFLPVLGGVLTTLAPFFPLLFWPGVTGKFMRFIPITMIAMLMASLFVAFVLNPVFAASFMRETHPSLFKISARKVRKTLFWMAVLLGVSGLWHLLGLHSLGNLFIIFAALFVFGRLLLERVQLTFQNRVIPWFQRGYSRIIIWALHKRNPAYVLVGTVGLLFFSFFMILVNSPSVVFFPQSEPNFVYVYLKLPTGTHVEYTDSIVNVLEKRVKQVLAGQEHLVESVMSNVALAAGDPQDFDRSVRSNMGKVTVSFVPYEARDGFSTLEIMDRIREAMPKVPGAEISVAQEANGPPVGKPVSIQVMGEDYEALIAYSRGLRKYLDSLQIPGVEELKSDLDDQKPEIFIDINREAANRLGITTGQIGGEVRTALYGKAVSTYRDQEDDYDIVLRYTEPYRTDLGALMNLKITYRDMATGSVRSVPLSSVASVSYQNTYGVVKRRDQKRVINLESEVLTGYTPNDVNAALTSAIADFPAPDGIIVNQGGEQEDQKETADFLGVAFMMSIMLILFILVAMFKSYGKTLIILFSVLLSTIGVLLGYSLTQMTLSIVMTGVGIVALAGIVVNNAIILIEFTDLLKAQGLRTRDAIIQAGETRLQPVLLTTFTTVLGLIPLATGFNIDFSKFLANFDPGITIGGDNVAFFGPLSWTIIFGLSFSAVLTLVVVPVLYQMHYGLKLRMRRASHRRFMRRQRTLRQAVAAATA